MSEENNEVWMLRSARLDQQPTVQKLLKEGFEPFWGTIVIVDKKGEKEKVIKMYFRKPPTFVLTAVEEPLVKFDMGPVEEFSNQFRSALSGVLDTFIDSFFGRLDKYEFSENERVGKEVAEKQGINLDEEPNDEDQEDDGVESNGPHGNDFRVVDDVPQDITTKRTNGQIATIEELRLQGNVTVLPGTNEDGSVRVMLGADLYTIARDGNFTVENTGAGTNSQIVGG